MDGIYGYMVREKVLTIDPVRTDGIRRAAPRPLRRLPAVFITREVIAPMFEEYIR